MLARLAFVALVLSPSLASAQVVVVPVPVPPPPPLVPPPPPVPPPPCVIGAPCTFCPVCVAGAPCFVCEGGIVADGSVSVPGVSVDGGVAIEGGISVGGGASAQGGGTGSQSTLPPPPPPPVDPAPGTLELGYYGGTDFTYAFHGFALRTTGHVDDVHFVDLVLGASGNDASPRSIYELLAMLGYRVAGPVVPNVLRLFAAIDVGLAARGIADVATWGALAADVGIGLEVGFGDPFTIGFFTDVRLASRVPFERETPWVGIGWSAGLAVLWF